jgi:hypothetical protein
MNNQKTPTTLRQLVFGLLVFVVLLLLLGISLPLFSSPCRHAPQNTALQQAKGIFYGLKMFATDHNGRYPSVLEEDFVAYGPTPALTDANHAYANIVPTYVQSERPFSVPLSAYCQTASGKPIVPDNDFSDHRKVLAAGQNHYAYILGLTDASDPAWPIMADGFAGGPGAITNPTYSKTKGAYGGTWEGRNAIVVRCDGSASILPIDQTTLTIPRPGQSTANLLTPSTDPADPWLTGCTVLNPLQNH